jgi:MFS transporter, ACS family, solute carrier family 17 (sodium-dependent inorganic phosphate cotransporter), member 5
MLQYMQKIDMSMGIVCMVNQTVNNNSHTVDSNNNNNDGTFDWSKDIQGFILSSYFYGYILTQVKENINSQHKNVFCNFK